jgi:hypothetical protein
MSEPLRLVTDRDRYARECVEVLREMLTRAEAGEFTSVIVIGDRAEGGELVHRHSPAPDYAALIGRLSITRAMIERSALGG